MAKTFLDIQNIRATKLSDDTAGRITDPDLARFYNQVTSDMAKYGQNLKKVVTNVVANQEEYTKTVVPGLIATEFVRIGGTIAPYIDILDYQYETDRGVQRHSIINNSLVILPKPTIAVTNGLEVWYWGKLPEIIDAAVGGTSLAELDDKDWSVVVSGITAKCFEKLIILMASNRESIIDLEFNQLIKLHESLNKQYQTDLENYGNTARLAHYKNTNTIAARENENTIGTGRQDK